MLYSVNPLKSKHILLSPSHHTYLYSYSFPEFVITAETNFTPPPPKTYAAPLILAHAYSAPFYKVATVSEEVNLGSRDSFFYDGYIYREKDKVKSGKNSGERNWLQKDANDEFLVRNNLLAILVRIILRRILVRKTLSSNKETISLKPDFSEPANSDITP